MRFILFAILVWAGSGQQVKERLGFLDPAALAEVFGEPPSTIATTTEPRTTVTTARPTETTTRPTVRRRRPTVRTRRPTVRTTRPTVRTTRPTVRRTRPTDIDRKRGNLERNCKKRKKCCLNCPHEDGDNCSKKNYALVVTGGDNPQRLDSSEQISYMGVCSSPNVPLLPQAITGGKSVWIEPDTLMFCGGSPTYVGGGAVSGAIHTCLKLTPGSNNWDSNPLYNMNVARSWFSLNYINGDVVAAGGLANDNTVLDTLEIYSNGEWKMLDDIKLDKPTYVHCAVSYTRGGNSYLMIIGGSNTYGAFDITASVTVINLSTGDKVSVAPEPLPGLWAPACTICGDDIYVSGGGKKSGDGAIQTTDVYKYNIPAGGPFTLLPGTMNTPRWGHTMGVTSRGQLVISGGVGTEYFSSIETSEDAGASWITWRTGLSKKQEYAAMASVPVFTFTCTGG